jgi:hypothetical protein
LLILDDLDTDVVTNPMLSNAESLTGKSDLSLDQVLTTWTRVKPKLKKLMKSTDSNISVGPEKSNALTKWTWNKSGNENSLTTMIEKSSASLEDKQDPLRFVRPFFKRTILFKMQTLQIGRDHSRLVAEG